MRSHTTEATLPRHLRHRRESRISGVNFVCDLCPDRPSSGTYLAFSILIWSLTGFRNLCLLPAWTLFCQRQYDRDSASSPQVHVNHPSLYRPCLLEVATTRRSHKTARTGHSYKRLASAMTPFYIHRSCYPSTMVSGKVSCLHRSISCTHSLTSLSSARRTCRPSGPSLA